MSDKFKLFWLGIVILGAIAILAWFLLFLRPLVGDAEKELRVRFADIDRVTTGTQVTYAGKPVGEVDRIDRVHNAREHAVDGTIYPYELTLKVDSSVSVYTYDDIRYVTAGLLGEKSITILPKGAPQGMPPPEDISDQILYGNASDPIDTALDQLQGASDTFTTAVDKVSTLIDDNREQFEEALESLTAAADEVRELFQQTLDQEFVAKASQAATDLSSAMVRAEKVLSQMLSDELVGHLTQSVASVEEVMGQIAAGQGTVGRLIKEDLLYEQLSSTLDALDTTLQDVNEYGILFQFSGKWQRKKRLRKIQQQRMNACR